MKKSFVFTLLLLFFTITLSTFTSCREEKTAGEKIEEGIEDVGDGIEEGVEEIEDEIDDNTDEN
ncbi:hypothetical protein [Cellulophaga sp. Hel_I_12]|uniref:hypothetical protein n=1 Tax=Cellulophaga sp. Hel_I_12 TaxID=1249972 RepID=UPI0006459B70|nr:hypothetical protein [Cellulophaga sp. Hel_I_12]